MKQVAGRIWPVGPNVPALVQEFVFLHLTSSSKQVQYACSKPPKLVSPLLQMHMCSPIDSQSL